MYVGSVVYDPVPVQIPVGLNFTQIDIYDKHTLALASNGSVYSWGSNNDGIIIRHKLNY